MRRSMFIFGAVLLATVSYGKAASGKKLLPSAATPSAAPAAMPAVIEVKIDNFKFGPEVLTIPVGATVIWTNRDDIPHTVVSTDGIFKSKVLDTDEKFSFTFTKAGTYDYFCSVHPKMTGKVIVQ